MTVDRLSEIDWPLHLTYEHTTGVFLWLQREVRSKHDKAFNSRFSGCEAGSISRDGYRVIRVKGQSYLSHRIAWIMHFGVVPSHGIDHINGNRSDNRILNLRDVPQSLNLKNLRISEKNKSGHPGVYFSRRDNVWHAQIYERGKPIYLGHSKDFDAAVTLRKNAEADLGYHPNHGRPA